MEAKYSPLFAPRKWSVYDSGGHYHEGFHRICCEETSALETKSLKKF